MKKTKIVLVSILSMIIFVATFSSCEKDEITEVEENAQPTEINTFEKFYSSIEDRIISVDEDYEDEDGVRGILYVISLETGGEEEIIVLDKTQEKGGVPWLWINGTLHSYDDGSYRCYGASRNCRVRFGKIYVNYDL